MPDRRRALARARRAAGLTQEDLAHRVGVDRSTVGRWEAGETDPQLWVRQTLAHTLDISPTTLVSLLGAAVEGGACACADHEVEAHELARRVAASDVGGATLTQLEHAVDDLASSYATAPPGELLDRTRGHLHYVIGLLDARKTLAEHRRLLVIGGWLSLLAGTLHIDLEQQGAAVARLRTARTLAEESGHDEIAAWTLETEAWRVLTLGDYRRVVELAQGAQHLAPAGSSARIQATAQEGRARARMSDARATTALVARVNRMAEPLSAPDRPEHHYRYDPAKATSYTATTLSWVGDPAAADHAREVIRRLSVEGAHGGRPRRLAVARLDLALALLQRGEVDEATDEALVALRSGRVAPSNAWRAQEVVHAVEAADGGASATLREAYQELRAADNR